MGVHKFGAGVALVVACLACSAAAQMQFTKGTPVEVATDALKVRQAPGLRAAILGVQRHGRRGIVADASPYWKDGYWWWHIDYSTGPSGWSAEGDSNEAYLVAVQPGSPSASPSTASPSSPAGSSNLTIVVVPSVTAALSLSKATLVVAIEGPVKRVKWIKNVAPAYPVTVEFVGIPAGTYQVTAAHMGRTLKKQIEVSGDTLEVNFVMP